jgi:hypothetical protein
LRDDGCVKVVVAALRAKAMHGLADILQKLQLPTFANWRWSTLFHATEKVIAIWGSLRPNLDLSVFKNSRDRSRLTKVAYTIEQQSWNILFPFVNWFCRTICLIQDWIGGCECHEAQLMRGERIDCRHKGRRIVEAYPHAVAELRNFLNVANSWTVSKFDGDLSLLLQCQACVRATFALALQKIDFLNCLPWNLARLGQPGVRDLCLHQWQLVSPERHCETTKRILDPDGILIGDVHAIDDDGQGVSFRLALEFQRGVIWLLTRGCYEF